MFDPVSPSKRQEEEDGEHKHIYGLFTILDLTLAKELNLLGLF
jgi:hypothetical protein